MKVKIRPRLDLLINERKIKTATNFAKQMTAAGYKLSTSQAARYMNDSPQPTFSVGFVEAACNVLQCLPTDLYDITITTDPGEVLNPFLAIPYNAKRLTAEPSASSDAPPAPEAATSPTVPWEGKYGVAGPKITALPQPKKKV